MSGYRQWHMMDECASNRAAALARIAELEAASGAWDEKLRLEQISHTETEERAERAEAALAERDRMLEQWIWVAHMVWAVPDPHDADARSFPLRLAEQWQPGLSYHDGKFHDIRGRASAPDFECNHVCEPCEWYAPGADQGPCTTDDPREQPDDCPRAKEGSE